VIYRLIADFFQNVPAAVISLARVSVDKQTTTETAFI